MLEPLPLSRLLQLASPLLPIGAYSYSQGLEWAIESGRVTDAATAQRWISDVLKLYLGRFELPLLQRLRLAWDAQDAAALDYWNGFFCAGRDNAEARAETLQMGYSMLRLLKDLDDFDDAIIARVANIKPLSFPLAYACASSVWQISTEASLQAYLWSWAENQVSAAMKAVPLGQVAGQRMLVSIGACLPGVLHDAAVMQDDELGNFCPGLAIAGCRHETQYSRIFRS